MGRPLYSSYAEGYLSLSARAAVDTELMSSKQDTKKEHIRTVPNANISENYDEHLVDDQAARRSAKNQSTGHLDAVLDARQMRAAGINTASERQNDA